MSGMTPETDGFNRRKQAEREAAESVIRRKGGKGGAKALRAARKHLKVK